jgi:predicted dehydrogenase
LPNDLHVEWSIRAAEAGKHVLCEKPIGMNVADAQKLIAVRDRLAHEGRPVKIGEAFMVRLHPQWIRAQELISAGRIGELRLVQGAFSYFNIKPENIRNNRAAGGGALMDIGCYLIFLSRFLFRREPARVLALINRDPTFQTDRLTSMILDFTAADGEPAQAIASCSTQLIPHQRIQVFGARGRIEIEIPVNVPPDRPVNLLLDERGDLFGAGIVTESFPPSGSTPDHGSGNGIDQYTLQGDAFSRAILNDTEAPVPLEEALRNMAVIDALFRSAETNAWEKP